MEYQRPADQSADEEVAAIQAGIDDLNAERTEPLKEWDQKFCSQQNIFSHLYDQLCNKPFASSHLIGMQT